MTTYQHTYLQSPTLLDVIQGIIRGYVAIWGTADKRDAYGTWFDREAPPEMALDYLPFPVYYEHTQDETVRKEIVGSVTRIHFDDTGIAFEGTLDKSSAYFERMIGEIQEQELATSSATAEHVADFDELGRFVSWPVIEVSLTKNPAEERMPMVTLVRSDEQRRDASGEPEVTTVIPNTNISEELNPMSDETRQLEDMSLEEIMAALLQEYSAEEIMALLNMEGAPEEALSEPAAPDGAALVSALMDKLEARTQPDIPTEDEPVAVEPRNAPNGEVAKFMKEMRAMMRKQQEAAPPEQPRKAKLPVRVEVSEPRRYWAMDLQAMLFAHEVMRSRGIRISDDFMRTMAGRTEQAFEKRDALVDNLHVRSILPTTRADEIVTSTATGYGDEWIGIAYSGSLWEKARNNRIFQTLQGKGMRVEEVPQGHESTVIFTEGSDPTVYTLTQSADLDAVSRPTVIVPVTAPGTGQTTLTPGYLGMAVAYTSVFEEDSLIAAAPQLTRQMNEKAEETVEQLFINGDTATSGNVNYDGTTDSTTNYWKASNGARKYALVTGSSTSRDGGGLDENDFRLTLKLFPSAIRTRKTQCAFIIDSDTHNTALDILAAKTQDVRGTNATLDSGVLENIYGVDVMESGFLLLTASDGKVTYNATGTLGTILGVYAPYWAMGWKRRVTVETQKDILEQANLIVATFRLGFVYRGAGAAVASYNLTIA